MTMWVWRLSEKFAGQWSKSKPPTGPWDCRMFQINLLFNDQELTQGWGIPEPDLDLNTPRQQWAQKRRDWDLAVDGACTLEDAQSDYDLLICMRANVQIGDTVFIPKIGNNQLSNDHFVVVTVADKYRFKQRGIYPKLLHQYTWDQDYGQVIPVDSALIKTFPYSSRTLERRAFGAPFCTRIHRVPYSSYRGFDICLKKNNYPFKPY